MAGVMSASRSAARYASIIIVGGGCYGSYYVRQLLRARGSAALTFDNLVVVDRNPRCQVAASSHEPHVRIVQREWTEFFDEYLGAAAAGEFATNDAIVPSPL